MLAHAPPLPLIIDHTAILFGMNTDTAEAERRTLLALKHRDRVRRIRVRVYDPPSMSIIEAIGEVFPLLEYLHISLNTSLSLPSTLRAPHLRHLVLFNIAFPIGSPLLAGLVTLSLDYVNLFANFGPNEFLQQLSLMPHLETFRINFSSFFSTQDVQGELLQIPLSTHVALPKLRWFGFGGPSAYMDAVLPRITMPLLRVTEIMPRTSNLLDVTSSILSTLESMRKTENPGLCSVKVIFYHTHIAVVMYPHQRTGMPTFLFQPFYLGHDGMLDFTVQMFDGIRTVLSEVETLTLEDRAWVSYKRFALQTGWRELLMSFNQVRTLHVSGTDLIKGLSHSLRPRDGESAIELLPMLRVLSCTEGSHVVKSFKSFLAARRNAGFPVTIIHW